MDIGTAKPTAGRAGRGAPPPPRPRRPVGGRARWPGSSAEAAAALADIEATRPPGPARRRHRPLPAGGRRRPRHPRPVPRGARRARGRPATPAALHAPARRARSRGRRPHGAQQPPPGRPRPRGDARQRPPVLVLRPGLDAYPPTPFTHGRARAAARRPRRAHRGPATTRQLGGRASSTRCAACAPHPAACPAPPARPSATGSCCAHLDGRARARRGRRPGRRGAPGASPAASGPGSGATPASPGSSADDATTRSPCSPGAAGRLTDRRCASPSTTAWATTSSSCSTLDGTQPVDAGDRARPVRPAPASAPTASSAATQADAATGADVTMELFNADGSRGRDERQRHPLPRPGRRPGRRGASGPDARASPPTAGLAVGPRRPPSSRHARISVDMGPAKVVDAERPGRAPARAAPVDIGNPHLVLVVAAPADRRAVARRSARRVTPGGINVEFIAPTSAPATHSPCVVYERGVGPTQACGTGACAAAAAAPTTWGLVGATRRPSTCPAAPAEVDLGDVAAHA